ISILTVAASSPKRESASARQLGLADAGGTEEQEAADGPVRVGEPGGGASYGFGHRLDGLFLADDALVELAFEAQQDLTLLLGELAHRDAGGPGDDLGDVLGRHLRHRRTTIAAGFLDPLGRTDRFLLGFPRLPKVLGGDIPLVLKTPQLLFQCFRVPGFGLRTQVHPRRRQVHQVDSLIREEAAGNVAVGELGGGGDRLFGDLDAVVRLVAVLEAAQDLDSLVNGGLADEDRLQAEFQRRVLLYVLAVFVYRGCAHETHLTVCQGGLEHVGGVHRALYHAGSNHGMQLIEEDYLVIRVLPDLLYDLLEARLELSAILRPRDHPRQVQREDALIGERIRDLAVDDPLGKPLDDGRLADAGIPYKHRVVLGPPGEDLDKGLDLFCPPDDGIELAFFRHPRQVAAVLVHRRRRTGPGPVAAPGGAYLVITQVFADGLE